MGVLRIVNRRSCSPRRWSLWCLGCDAAVVFEMILEWGRANTQCFLQVAPSTECKLANGVGRAVITEVQPAQCVP